jgi:anti-anti-sigma factor
MNARLRVVEGKPQGVEIPLRGPSFVIGRDPSCDLRPKHESVDAKHCRLSLKGDHVSVRDLGSEGGTRLNGRRLSPADSVIACNGDQLAVGNLVFEVAIPKPPSVDSLIGEDDPGEDSPAAVANRLLQKTLGSDTATMRGVGGRFQADVVDGVPVVTIEIASLVGDGVVPLRRELRNLAERPTLNRVVLDFQKVRRVSTEAAEVLLAFHDRLKARHAIVKLCGVAPEVRRVFDATGVAEQVHIAFDQHDAIWSSW